MADKELSTVSVIALAAGLYVWGVRDIGGAEPQDAVLFNADEFATQTQLALKADATHSHTISDVTGLSAALALKAPLADPTFTGVPLAPTATGGTNTFQIATTAFVTGAVNAVIAAADAMVFKGVIDCSTNPNYPAADRGWTYKISVAGKIGGASGINVEAGDTILCLTDGTVAGNHATVGAQWNITQANLDGVVIGPVSSVDDYFALFSGTSGKLLKSISPADVKLALNLTGSNTGDQTITLTGEATGSGTGSFVVSLSGAAVIAKVLTGFTSGAGVVAATDSILQAIQKLDGNDASKMAGAGSSTDNAIVRMDGTGGKTAQNSLVTIDDNGKVVGVTGSTATATLNVPHGVAPTSPVNGDLWSTTAGIFMRVNGVTIGPLSDGGGGGTTVLTSTATGTQNNFTPGTFGANTLVNWSGADPAVITGIAAGANNDELTITNTGATAAVFAYDFASSTAANRISWGSAVEHLVIFPGESITFRYSTGSSRWIVTQFPFGSLRVEHKKFYQYPMTTTPTGSGGHNGLGGTVSQLQPSQSGVTGLHGLDPWQTCTTTSSAGSVSGSRSVVAMTYATGGLYHTVTRFALTNENPLPAAADTNFAGIFASDTSPGNANWGSLTTGMLGMGRDPADTDRIYILHAAAGAAATKIDLGADFNRNDTKMFEMFAYMPPGVATPTVVMWIKNDLTILPQAYKPTTNVYSGAAQMFAYESICNRAAAATYTLRYVGWELWR